MAYGERLEQALTMAARLHRNQTRKGTGTPYVVHLLAVASLVGETGGDEDTVIAALLHDAVEDQGGKAALAVIRQTFGERVAEIVADCSDADQTPKPPWRQRKEAHLAHLAEASPEARHVVSADKLHNARCCLVDLRRDGLATFAKFNGGIDGTLWYYHAAVELLTAAQAPVDLTSELRRTVDELTRLTESLRKAAQRKG